VKWSTATEMGTDHFQLQRSLSANGPWDTIDEESRQGDDVTGSAYDYEDEDVELNTTYYYRLLEVRTDQQIVPVGNVVAVVAGVYATATPDGGGHPTNTPTPTLTPTPTVTPSPTTAPATHSPAATNTPVKATEPPAAHIIPGGATITPSSPVTYGDAQGATPFPAMTLDAGQLPVKPPPAGSMLPAAPPVTLPDGAGEGSTIPAGQPAPESQPAPTWPAPAPLQSGPGANSAGSAAASPAQPEAVDPVVINTTNATPDTPAATQTAAAPLLALVALALTLLVGGSLIIMRNMRS
jgi:hypothetical protein